MSIHSIHICLPADIDAHWSQFAPLVEAALDRDFTPEHVLGMIRAGKAQLWYTSPQDRVETVLVTSLHTYPARTVCQLWLCSGPLPANWEDFLSMLEAWAASQGCDALSLHGRRGWERKLGREGWDVREVWMEKRLNPSTSTVQ